MHKHKYSETHTHEHMCGKCQVLCMLFEGFAPLPALRVSGAVYQLRDVLLGSAAPNGIVCVCVWRDGSTVRSERRRR